MTPNMLFGAIALFVVGLVLFAKSKKTKEAGEDWSSALQWGYLLMLVGVFGGLSYFMSFTAVLLIFVLVTGVVWFYDRAQTKKKTDQASNKHHFVDYMRGFFPVIFVVFVLRSFVAEPFQIPSSSMRPGLVVGDFILVNKFVYGLRLPVANKVIIPVGEVERGDVAVFNYPRDPSLNYIKRIVGVPGDVIDYHNKVLTINGEVIKDEFVGEASYLEATPQGPVNLNNNLFDETMGDKRYQVYQMPQMPTLQLSGVDSDFPFRDQCLYEENGFTCKVPQGQYFAMGDNRDNSEDSRYWGFVDSQYIVGKAFLVWMNFGDFSRVGTKIQ
ncbi:MAG: signal peptidase I [Neisseriaceae bacterium]|nr:signal peptidase I [Neisseriaceae bacterium]